MIDVLNRYLEEMSDAIMDHGGTLVAYMGDGIMAVFGAPIEQDDHADRALAAAREMLAVRLPRFNAWLRGAGPRRRLPDGHRHQQRPVMSGNVGSERRIEYTAIGDTTNTAARLEGMTKGTPHQLVHRRLDPRGDGRRRRASSSSTSSMSAGEPRASESGRWDKSGGAPARYVRLVIQRAPGRFASTLRALAIDFGNRDLGLPRGRPGRRSRSRSGASRSRSASTASRPTARSASAWSPSVRLLPGALASPFAGLLVDRYPRRTVLLGSSLAIAVVLAGAAAAAALDAPPGSSTSSPPSSRSPPAPTARPSRR